MDRDPDKPWERDTGRPGNHGREPLWDKERPWATVKDGLAPREAARRAESGLSHYPFGRDLVPKGEFREQALQELVARHLDNPKSLAAPGIKVHGEDIREALRRMGPDDRHEYREQLTAELMHKAIFCPDGYCRVSDGVATKWEDLHDSQKHQLLEEAEAITAYLAERTPCRVIVVDGDSRGGFDPFGNTIQLGHAHTMNWQVSEHYAMETLFHEQAHKYQIVVITEEWRHEEVDPATREEWKENFRPGNYKRWGASDDEQRAYWDQPVERHARAASKQWVERIDDLRRREQL